MAGINEEVKVTEGVFGGISMSDNEAQESVLNTGSNLPAKTGFWSRVKSVLFYDIKVELTPYQQKVEDEINEFLHQEITWQKVKDFLFQEVTFGRKAKA